ncbi:MAG: hypothetical protein IH617_11340 [Hydrogenophaga sp.]|nr:hypothetical protein [Hydrogenophaga sp.]
MLKRFDTGQGARFAEHLRVIVLPFALSGLQPSIRSEDQMNRGPSPVQPIGLVEPLDIDLDTLDHALMELLTSDWQTLDDGEPSDAAVVAQRLSLAARGATA